MDLTLKFDIDVETSTALKVTTDLWDHEEIKNDVQNYFTKWEQNLSFITPRNSEWLTILRKVSEHAKLLELSTELSTKVENLIEPIGEKVFYWYLYLLGELHLDFKYAKIIYWTSYGTIDECKIFDLYWTRIFEKIIKEPIASFSKLIFHACVLARKDFIKKNIHIFRKGIEYVLAPLQISNMNRVSAFGIIVIHFCYLITGQNKEKAQELYKILNKENSVASALFSWSHANNIYEATKYFWYKLDAGEKKILTKEKAQISLMFFRECKGHESEERHKIFIFLVNKMPPDQRERLILGSLGVITEFFSYSWPFIELINSIIEDCLKRLSPYDIEDSFFTRPSFFIFILNFISDDNGYQTKKVIVKKSIQEIFIKTLQKVSKRDKIVKLMNHESFLDTMFQSFDVPILSAVLNDNDLSDKRNEILDRYHYKFKKLIISRNFDKLNEFIANIFTSENELKQFKLKFNFVEELLIEGKYYLADELLTWISDSNDDRILLKKQINAMKICSEFKNLFQMNRFLQWQFDNKLERDIFKQTLKNDEFIRDIIMKIYNENNKAIDSQCYEFLKWICGTEAEAVELKKKFVFEEDVARKFSAFLPSPESFKKINELGLLFDLAPEEELSVKQKIVSNKDEWIFTYTVSRKKC